MTLGSRRFLTAARRAATLCHDKKAEDILLLDARPIAGLADYYVLATVDSAPQLQAVQDHVAAQLKENAGLVPLRRDGRGSGQWSVLDYGGLVVHVMHREARAFYQLERLWEGAKAQAWREEKKEAPARKHKVSMKK